MQDRKKYLTAPEKSIEVGKKSISKLLEEMAQTGFQGKRLGEAARIWAEMTQQKGLTIFMGYSGSMSTTGQWKLVRWLIENRYIDVLVSTGANISEDILEAMGYNYYQGTWLANDEDLLEAKVDRFYDIYADEYEYRELEGLIRKFASTLDTKRSYSTREFLNRFGEYQWKKGIKSITATAWKYGVPVYSPGLIDSGYGVALSLLKREEGKLVRLDQTQDMEELGQIADRSKRTAVVYIGGGVPKDTIQLASIIKSLSKGGEESTPHDYAHPDHHRQPAVGRPLGVHPRGGDQLGQDRRRLDEERGVLRRDDSAPPDRPLDEREGGEEEGRTRPGLGLQEQVTSAR